MRALALIEPNGPPSKQLRQQDAELDEQAASAIEALTAERDRWHRVAMDAGAVVCVDGQIRFAKDSYKARAHAAEARNKELREGLNAAAARFREYEALHAAKPDAEKARRNAEMAEMCERLLAQPKTSKGGPGNG